MRVLLLLMLAGSLSILRAQTTFPVNGPQHVVPTEYALVGATVFVNADTRISNATVWIKDGKIVYAGPQKTLPKEVMLMDCRGQFVYPAFVELSSSYGIQPVADNRKPEHQTRQFVSAKKGAYNWNEAIKSEFQSVQYFAVDEKRAAQLRACGIATVLTSQQDGICRGSSALVFTGNASEQESILKAKAAATYSFNKGSSRQQYPSSLMGSIALLRQTYYDAQWYQTQQTETNLTLDAFAQNSKLPSLFVADGKFNILRADKIGDEFGVQYIIKGAGDEYQMTEAIKATGATLVVPVNFPGVIDVENPFDAEFVSTADLKHWEMAPYNLRLLAEANIPFAITTDGCDADRFLKNIRKAVKYGLPESKALKALTETPATLLNMQKEVGAIQAGMYANLIVSSAPIFKEEAVIVQTWVKGIPYQVNQPSPNAINGLYDIKLPEKTSYSLLATRLKGKTEYKLAGKDTLTVLVTEESGQYTGTASNKSDSLIRFSVWVEKVDSSRIPHRVLSLKGSWVSSSGIRLPVQFVWKDSLKETVAAKDTTTIPVIPQTITYPFTDYGFTQLPTQQTILFKHATVWTNEQEGVLIDADVLVVNGKISEVGKNLKAKNAIEVDATGKHITAGIIDEHSHIAISNGVNEGTQSSSSEVRIGDVLNAEDINIYRQLAGGVVASQLLHGSANPIGGQNAIVKLRWGFTPEQMKIAGSDGFIKFALGENVKQSNWGDGATFRYPQTRMGVEQTFYDAFIRAKEYEQLRKANPSTRKDLELEALVEILNNKRFITCHSYVQSEINMLLHVADSMHFKVNTFTHILEGYKVADKLKAHGAYASTFADWWAYKYEVMEAIPYNAAILHKMGVVTAINSDDAEMGRRLNQEAAKVVKYGGVSEEEALKMVTLNPAKMLHLDAQMGSVKPGKDADIVLWSAYPLSIYATADMTLVDGRIMYSKQTDEQLRVEIRQTRQRIIKKMIAAKRNGEKAEKKISKPQDEYHCND
jgi:imidazolonepropionase-like amidohydrolase